MDKKINRNSSTSLHIQIRNEILGNILNGILKPGDKLPSENELSNKFNVSRSTVRLALSDLTRKEFVYSKPGKGTFVAFSVINEAKMDLVGFIDSPENEGIIEKVEVIENEKSKSLGHIYARLQINPGEKILSITSLRYTNNSVIGVDISYLPEGLFFKISSMSIEKEPLDHVFYTLGIAPKRIEQMIQICKPTDEIIRYLALENNFPVMYIERISFLAGEIPIEYRKTYFHGDSYRLNMIMEKKPNNHHELME